MTRVNVAHVNKKHEPLADDVFASIHTIMHLFRAEQYRVLREGRYDLTHMEGKILGFFNRHRWRDAARSGRPFKAGQGTARPVDQEPQGSGSA